ncbi:MAG: hypothetical protein AAF725_05025 [Acidobacteriota bacterium]
MAVSSEFADLRIPGLDFGKRRIARRILATCALLLVAAAFYFPVPGFPAEERAEIEVKIFLVLAALALMLVRELEAPRPIGKAGAALSMAAALAAGAYLNFGAFHGRVAVHYWEHFHYALGAKYFPELGYDGLYSASLEAQLAVAPRQRLQPYIRDLRTNEVVRSGAPATLEHRHEVVSRFSQKRWDAFVRDHRHFLEVNNLDYLASIRRDHGFNPPPSWTFVARLFARWPALDAQALKALALLDGFLLLILFAFLLRTFGSRVACLSAVLFGLNYAGRYYWVGGAFLREDWLVAVGVALCMLEKGRYRWAGALLGYATAVRIFPVLFLFGPGIVALRALLRRERPRWILDLAVGFALALAVAALAGSLTGRGPGAWSEFAQSITLHRETWLTNNVGLENVVLYDAATFEGRLVSRSQPEPWLDWKAHMSQRKEQKAALLASVKIALLLFLAAAAWRLDLARAGALGIGAVFTLVLTTCYYWQMLLLVPLLRHRILLYGALLLQLGLFALHLEEPTFEVRYGGFSWGLLVLFLVGFAPWALGALRASAKRRAAADG